MLWAGFDRVGESDLRRRWRCWGPMRRRWWSEGVAGRTPPYASNQRPDPVDKGCGRGAARAPGQGTAVYCASGRPSNRHLAQLALCKFVADDQFDGNGQPRPSTAAAISRWGDADVTALCRVRILTPHCSSNAISSAPDTTTAASPHRPARRPAATAHRPEPSACGQMLDLDARALGRKPAMARSKPSARRSTSVANGRHRHLDAGMQRPEFGQARQDQVLPDKGRCGRPAARAAVRPVAGRQCRPRWWQNRRARDCARRSPCGVRLTARPRRWTSGTPNSRSNARTCWAMAAWVTFSARPAPVKPPCCAVA